MIARTPAPLDRGGAAYRLLRAIVRGLLTVGWRLRVAGLSHIPGAGPFLIISNHPSESDPVVLAAALPFRPTFLAARELERFPLLFALIRLFNPVFVRRGLSDIAAVRACLARLKAGQALVIFPEGRVVQDADLGPLHPGAAFVALRAGVPLLPVALLGTARMWPLGARRPRASRLSVRIGTPIPAAGDPRQLTVELDRALRDLLARGPLS